MNIVEKAATHISEISNLKFKKFSLTFNLE